MVVLEFKEDDIAKYKQGPLECVMHYGEYMYIPFYVKIKPEELNGELISFGDLPEFLKETVINFIHEQIDPSKPKRP